jgi:hypothetical protein
MRALIRHNANSQRGNQAAKVLAAKLGNDGERICQAALDSV